MRSRWARGDVVALRMFRRGRVFWVAPVRVVEDSTEVTALFLAADTATRTAVYPEFGRTFDRSFPYERSYWGDWVLEDGRWRENSVLMLARPGAAHSFWAFWDAGAWEFVAWYVNCQAPLARTAIGFDTEDHELDVVIEPDMSSWEWKDEADLAEAVRVGRFTDDEASAIRAEAMKAVGAFDARDWPFGLGFEGWRPDAGWAPPVLDPAWELSPPRAD